MYVILWSFLFYNIVIHRKHVFTWKKNQKWNKIFYIYNNTSKTHKVIAIQFVPCRCFPKMKSEREFLWMSFNWCTFRQVWLLLCYRQKQTPIKTATMFIKLSQKVEQQFVYVVIITILCFNNIYAHPLESTKTLR